MEKIMYPPKNNWDKILNRPSIATKELESKVSSILIDIKLNGDEAIKKYTLQFDKITLDSFKITQTEINDSE